MGHTTENKQLKTFQVAFYGSVEGKQKRIQVKGTEKELYQVAKLVMPNDISSVVIGDWDKETIRLDFDNTPLREVKLWAYRAYHWFKLDGFIILRSSMKEYVVKEKKRVIYRCLKGNYLVIFNRVVNWNTNVKVMNWVGLESGNPNLKKYVTMQCIKKTSTVRISYKGDKKPPKVIFRFGNQDKQIKQFLETRKITLNIIKQQKKRIEKGDD